MDGLPGRHCRRICIGFSSLLSWSAAVTHHNSLSGSFECCCLLQQPVQSLTDLEQAAPYTMQHHHSPHTQSCMAAQTPVSAFPCCAWLHCFWGGSYHLALPSSLSSYYPFKP
ncbi:hypothetical protein COO60DRAFT_644690 [Scenedesmus sp. NREL 46B-D3]|nr:hypothetical protein COO60DRAFT_644690 [Scenedesmus sp. NREL 46B-D3]